MKSAPAPDPTEIALAVFYHLLGKGGNIKNNGILEIETRLQEITKTDAGRRFFEDVKTRFIDLFLPDSEWIKPGTRPFKHQEVIVTIFTGILLPGLRYSTHEMLYLENGAWSAGRTVYYEDKYIVAWKPMPKPCIPKSKPR